MLVKKISVLTKNSLKEFLDPEDGNIDVFVELENGSKFVLVMATPKNLIYLMDKDKMDFLEPDDPFVIVRSLTKKIIKEAVNSYAKDNGYWLKYYHFGGGVNITVFNRLEEEYAESRKELDEENDIDERLSKFDDIFPNLDDVEDLDYS
uniref:Uncharacterized protein n=1 Tax=Climaconeis cf. scalaris TaxID=2846828 RepID=A0A8F8SQ22_9STRA|nr:hypothetical protein [Climaconeis cf. scalaris]